MQFVIVSSYVFKASLHMVNYIYLYDVVILAASHATEGILLVFQSHQITVDVIVIKQQTDTFLENMMASADKINSSLLVAAIMYDRNSVAGMINSFMEANADIPAANTDSAADKEREFRV